MTQALEAERTQGIVGVVGEPRADQRLEAVPGRLGRRGERERIVIPRRDEHLPLAIRRVLVPLDPAAVGIDQPEDAVLAVADRVVAVVGRRLGLGVERVEHLGFDQFVDVGQPPDVALRRFDIAELPTLVDDARAVAVEVRRPVVDLGPRDAAVLAVVGVGGDHAAGLEGVGTVSVATLGLHQAAERVVGVGREGAWQKESGAMDLSRNSIAL